MTTAQESPTCQERRVRVWFGEHAIADYKAGPALAKRYAEAMDRRFPGLRITNEPVPLVPTPPVDGDPFQLPLPENELRWPLTVI
jgi:hypothetical protein